MHIVTGSRIGEKRKLDAKLRLGRSQEVVNKNSIAPSIQLQSLGGFLTVIAYRRWNFRTLELSKAISKQEKQGSATYIQFTKEIDNGNGVWESCESRDNLERGLKKRGKW